VETLYKNPLYSEHLKKEAKPIMACLGTFRDFEISADETSKRLIHPNDNHSDYCEDIDYYAKSSDGKNIGSKTCGESTYVISPVSSYDKMTRYLYDCTTVVAAGRDKYTEEEISFLSHQDPFVILPKGRYCGQFICDLMDSLFQMKKRCEEGTIDIVIAGGNYFVNNLFNSHDPKVMEESREIYKKSTSFLSKIVLRIFDFEPVIIVGPKTTDRSDALFYVNKWRRLYILRPEVGNAATESFLPQDILIQEGKW